MNWGQDGPGPAKGLDAQALDAAAPGPPADAEGAAATGDAASARREWQPAQRKTPAPRRGQGAYDWLLRTSLRPCPSSLFCHGIICRRSTGARWRLKSPVPRRPSWTTRHGFPPPSALAGLKSGPRCLEVPAHRGSAGSCRTGTITASCHRRPDPMRATVLLPRPVFPGPFCICKKRSWQQGPSSCHDLYPETGHTLSRPPGVLVLDVSARRRGTLEPILLRRPEEPFFPLFARRVSLGAVLPAGAGLSRRGPRAAAKLSGCDGSPGQSAALAYRTKKLGNPCRSPLLRMERPCQKKHACTCKE